MKKERTADLPLRELTENDRKAVDVTKMGEYAIIFFNVEHQIVLYWMEHPHLKDRTVIATLKNLTKNFDKHKESSLAWRISRAVKEGLLISEIEGRVYTYGEVISCLRLLKRIAKIHRAPHGRGYLFWVQTFFAGKIPETQKEIREYIQKYES